MSRGVARTYKSSRPFWFVTPCHTPIEALNFSVEKAQACDTNYTLLAQFSLWYVTLP